MPHASTEALCLGRLHLLKGRVARRRSGLSPPHGDHPRQAKAPVHGRGFAL